MCPAFSHRALVLALALPAACPALAHCGCGDNHQDSISSGEAAAVAVGIAGGLAVMALTAPLWMEDGHPYVEGDMGDVLGGRITPSLAHPEMEDRQAVGGFGGTLAAGMSRLPPIGRTGLGIRGEVACWHQEFGLRNPTPEPGPQNFNATALALGAHVDGQIRELPVVVSLGGRLGGAWLDNPVTHDGAAAWDVEAVAGLGVRLDSHLTLVGDVRGVLLLPGRNAFSSGNSHAVIADVGLRYTF